MKLSARVTSEYPDGTSEVQECPQDNYVLVTGPDLYLHHVQKYANGTTILTIKRHPKEGSDEGKAPTEAS